MFVNSPGSSPLHFGYMPLLIRCGLPIRSIARPIHINRSVCLVSVIGLILNRSKCRHCVHGLFSLLTLQAQHVHLSTPTVTFLFSSIVRIQCSVVSVWEWISVFQQFGHAVYPLFCLSVDAGYTPRHYTFTFTSCIHYGVHDRLHIYPLYEIFYFPWHRHHIEGTNGF